MRVNDMIKLLEKVENKQRKISISIEDTKQDNYISETVSILDRGSDNVEIFTYGWFLTRKNR